MHAQRLRERKLFDFGGREASRSMKLMASDIEGPFWLYKNL
jgi:hypothetical protein